MYKDLMLSQRDGVTIYATSEFGSTQIEQSRIRRRDLVRHVYQIKTFS